MTNSTSAPANAASAGHVDTCGVHFPRLMSDAYAFEQPGASAISYSPDYEPEEGQRAPTVPATAPKLPGARPSMAATSPAGTTCENRKPWPSSQPR